MAETSPRYEALDVLRGMTVAGMILVNNPGSWEYAYAPLRHAAWIGCTPTDLVFPFFLFIVGAAMAFSFAKYFDGALAVHAPNPYAKLYKRAALLFLVGLALNAFPFFRTRPNPDLTFWQNCGHLYSRLRIFGVLQRIALSYALAGSLALWLKKPKKIAVSFGALLLLYWGVLYFFGGEDPYSLETNVVRRLDLAMLGENHLYRGYGIPFDPEGLLGLISGAATALMGYLAGCRIRRGTDKRDTACLLFTAGLLSLGTAYVWSIWLPISKPLWTSSYVLCAGGWSLLLLAFFVYVVDVQGFRRGLLPFKALGMNPLFAFVMAALFSKVFGSLVSWTTASGGRTSALGWLYNNVFAAGFGDNEVASLLYALFYVLIFTLMAIGLYRKKIVIKL